MMRLLVGACLGVSTALCSLVPSGSESAADVPLQQAPQTLTFDELVTLATDDPPPAAISQKLTVLLTTPFISNSAAAHAPTRNDTVLRVAEWNINRGENEDWVAQALTDTSGFLSAARQNPKATKKLLAQVSSELQELQSADVLILDEVDHGVKRTKYRDVAKDLAGKLNMNYAYGVEFIELNRIYLGAKALDTPDATRSQSGNRFGLDPNKYLGLEGSAILSRYPIRSARIIRLPETYDWYHGEIQAVSTLEKARRWSAEKLFQERIARQVRRGNRMALVVDLAVPQSPTGSITVVCPHLEDYAPPKGRRRQMNYLLGQIQTETNPLILAGDMNTTGSSGRPVTVQSALRKYVLNYRFWARQIFFLAVPVPGLSYVLRGVNYVKNFRDPTAFSVPLLLPNPSKRFFNVVEHFRFADGTGFDFRGKSSLSLHGRRGTLSDTGERAWKGFVPSFSFQRTFGGLVGKYKIDWFFIRPPQVLPRSAPQFGRTLQHMNTALGPRISDHCPVTVTLPLSPQ